MHSNFRNVIERHSNSSAHGFPPPTRGTVLSSRIVLALWKKTGNEYLMSRFGELTVPLWKGGKI